MIQKIFEAQTSQTLQINQSADIQKQDFQLKDFQMLCQECTLMQKMFESSNSDNQNQYQKRIQQLNKKLKFIQQKQTYYYKQHLKQEFVQFIQQKDPLLNLNQLFNRPTKQQQVQTKQNTDKYNKIKRMDESTNEVLSKVHILCIKIKEARKSISSAKQKIKKRQFFIQQKIIIKQRKKQYIQNIYQLTGLKNKLNNIGSIRQNLIYKQFNDDKSTLTIKINKQEFENLILQSSKAYHQLEQLYFQKDIPHSALKQKVLKLMIQILIFRMTIKHVTFLKNIHQLKVILQFFQLISQQYFNSFDTYEIIIRNQGPDIIICRNKHSLQHRVYLKCKKIINLIQYIKYDQINEQTQLQKQYWSCMENYCLKQIQNTYHVSLEEFFKIGSVMQVTSDTQNIFQKYKNCQVQNFTTFYLQELKTLQNSTYIDPNQVKQVLYCFDHKYKWTSDYLNKVKYQKQTFRYIYLNPNIQILQIMLIKMIEPLIALHMQAQTIQIKYLLQNKEDFIMQFCFSKNFKQRTNLCTLMSFFNSIKNIINKCVVSSCIHTKPVWQEFIHFFKKRYIRKYCACKSFKKNNVCDNQNLRLSQTKKLQKQQNFCIQKIQNQFQTQVKALNRIFNFKKQLMKNQIKSLDYQCFYKSNIPGQKDNKNKIESHKIQQYFQSNSAILQQITKFWSHKFEINTQFKQGLQCIQFINQTRLFFHHFSDYLIQRQLKQLSNQEEQLLGYVDVFSLFAAQIAKFQKDKKQANIIWEEWDDLIQKIYKMVIRINSRQNKKWLIIKSCMCIQYYKYLKSKFMQKKKPSTNHKQMCIFQQLLNITDAVYHQRFSK